MLRLSRGVAHGTATIQVRGELTPGTAGAVGLAVDELVTEAPSNLILDLRDAVVDPSAAVDLLMGTIECAREAGTKVQLCAAAPVLDALASATTISMFEAIDAVVGAADALSALLAECAEDAVPVPDDTVTWVSTDEAPPTIEDPLRPPSTNTRAVAG
jgi:anti-anti-sigma regulatory factor